MKAIKLNPLNASKFFENLQPKVSTVINFKQPKTGLNNINRGEAFNGVVPEKITQKVDPLIGSIKKTIPPKVNNKPNLEIISKTEAFNGEVTGKIIPTIDNSANTTPNAAKSKTLKYVYICLGVIAVIGVGYLLYQKNKKENDKRQQ